MKNTSIVIATNDWQLSLLISSSPHCTLTLTFWFMDRLLPRSIMQDKLEVLLILGLGAVHEEERIRVFSPK
jgi:hypothetical protein